AEPAGGVEQVVRGIELGVTGQRGDEEGLRGTEIAVGVALAFARRDQFEAGRIAERLLEQQCADPLVSTDERHRAGIVSLVVDRAGESVERENLVAPAEIVLAEDRKSVVE